ncbi:hypothetical protein QF042_001749 [Pedobacter sp. W3I1]|nr:hypothetical protein [Pedobacter sp. W3I1]
MVCVLTDHLSAIPSSSLWWHRPRDEHCSADDRPRRIVISTAVEKSLNYVKRSLHFAALQSR